LLIFDLEDGVVTPQAQIALIFPIQKSEISNRKSSINKQGKKGHKKGRGKRRDKPA
jgi:hypothetical protein